METFDQVIHAGRTDVGVRRSHNQDTFAIQPAVDARHWTESGHVFLVADGMGGHAVGEKASAQAKRDLPHTYRKHAAGGAAAALRRAFVETNAGIHAVGQANPEFRGLGTTATALILREDGAWLGHVGDSRAYRLRDGHIEQLTYDHSLSWEVARQQGLDPDQVPEIRKNVIIRSLGPDALVEVDVEGPHPVLPGDVYLLCSDGLSNPLADEEIGSVMQALPPEEACDFLVELANLRGGPDNITVVIAKVPMPDGSDPPPTRSRPALKTVGMLRKATGAWNRSVPWPLTVLGLGLGLLTLFFIAQVNGWAGRGLIFALAAASTVTGLGGLIALSRREPDTDEEDMTAELHVYRRKSCPINRGLYQKMVRLSESLLEQAAESDTPISEAAHRAAAEKAQECAAKSDWPGAFREQCRAVQTLARDFHRRRNKEEVFRPRWDSASAG